MRLRQAQDDYQIDDETLGGQQANSLLELIKSGALKRKAPAQNKKAKAAADKAVAEAAKAREQQVCSNLLDPARSWGQLASERAVECLTSCTAKHLFKWQDASPTADAAAHLPGCSMPARPVELCGSRQWWLQLASTASLTSLIVAAGL